MGRGQSSVRKVAITSGLPSKSSKGSTSIFWSVPFNFILVPKLVTDMPIFNPEKRVIYCEPASMANAVADENEIDSWIIFSCRPILNRSLIFFPYAIPMAISDAEKVVPSPSGWNSVVLSISPMSR